MSITKSQLFPALALMGVLVGVAYLVQEPTCKAPQKGNRIHTSAPESQKYRIFFDVGQVLLGNSTTSAAKSVGVSTMFWYTLKHKTPEQSEIQGRLFEFIDSVTKKPRSKAMLSGEPLPQDVADFAAGKISSKKLISKILSFEKEADEFFISEEEKNLVFATLNLFKPDAIAKMQRAQKGMIKLFIECAEKFPGHVYILSNWDPESAAMIRKKFPEIFKAIPEDHIFFSGDIGMLKPEPKIYQFINNELDLAPKDCILIDDSKENVVAAKKLGWHTILHTDDSQTINKLDRILK